MSSTWTTNNAAQTKLLQSSEGGGEGVREEMIEFWQDHSKEANEEEMMLDSNAEKLGAMEIPEILSLLPPLHSSRVLELGAGIGRFSGKIALQAASVTAVDFMQSFVEKNRKKNGHMSNINFLQADVTKLNFPSNSFDLVFSNWLLMYLEEKEVESLFRKCFDWLSPKGFLFFRESCFYQSGNKSRASNPTLYRHPCIYNNIIININKTYQRTTQKNDDYASESDNDGYNFELVEARSVKTYIKIKKNRNQICWSVQKAKHNHKRHTNFETEKNKIFEYVSNDVVVGDNMANTACSMVSGELEILKKVEKMVEIGGQVLVVNCGKGAVVESLSYQHPSSYILGVDDVFNDVAMALDQANHTNNLQIQYQASHHYSNLRLAEHFDVVLNLVPLSMRQHFNFCSSVKDNMKHDGRLVVLQYVRESVANADDHAVLLDKTENIRLLMKSGWKCQTEFDVTKQKLFALEKDIQLIDNDDGGKVKLKKKAMLRLKASLNSNIRLKAFVCKLN